MAKHIVKCAICGEQFDANKEPFEKVSSRRYAHKSCVENKENLLTQEEKDKKNLEDYIIKLFKEEYVNPRIQKQINAYIKDYHYSYSGIHKSLVYFYEIKGNSIEKANSGIGIVPYVYEKARQYYYDLWLSQQKNENKDIEKYIPQNKIIYIARPERKIKKRKFFSFLDEEG